MFSKIIFAHDLVTLYHTKPMTPLLVHMISNIYILKQNKKVEPCPKAQKWARGTRWDIALSVTSAIRARYFPYRSFIRYYSHRRAHGANAHPNWRLVKQTWQGSRQDLSTTSLEVQVCSCSSPSSFSSSEISPRALGAADEDCLCCGAALLDRGFAVSALSPTNLSPGHSSLHTGHFSACCMRKKLRMQWSWSRPLHSRFSQRWP